MESLEKAFISDRAGLRIVDFLADETGFSRTLIKKIMTMGGVWRKSTDQPSERVHRHGEKVRLKDEIHLYYAPELLNIPKAHLKPVQDFGAYGLWYKPDTMTYRESLYCDHLTFFRALDRDLPKGHAVHLIAPEHPAIYGEILICYTLAAATKAQAHLNNGTEARFSLALGVSGHEAEEAVALLRDRGIAFERVKNRVIFNYAVARVSELIDTLESLWGREPDEPYCSCERLFPLGLKV